MSTFRPSITEVGSLKISNKKLAAATSSSNTAAALNNTDSFDGLRTGRVTVTMDTGHTVAAGASIIVTVVADQVTTDDVIVASLVGQSAGVPAQLMVTQTSAGQFQVGISNNHGSAAFASGSTVTFNWLIL